MDFHLDHKIVLSTEPALKSLYPWFLCEIDEEGKRVSRDQIPWNWSLYFTLHDITLFSSLKIDKYAKHAEENYYDILETKFIRAKLVPNLLRDKIFNDHTTYSMFGTKRLVSDFELEIHKLKEEDDEKEKCTAYGMVAHTTDMDIGRYITFDDNVVFSIYVLAEKFERYAAQVIQKTFSGGTLRLGGVKGFYSEWSPGISTNSIKILTGYQNDQTVEIPEACAISPPRLGEVEEFDLSLVSETKFLLPPSDKFDDAAEGGEVLERPSTPATHEMTPKFVPVADAATNHLLGSLRAAAWIIAALLLLELMFKR